MKNSKTLINIGRGILVIILGYIVLRLVNLPRTWMLESVLNLEINNKGFPTDQTAQIVYLIYIFLAGMAGAYVIGLILREKQWLHIWIFCGLLLINDVYAILYPLAHQPIWVKTAIFISLPFQVWIGGKLGILTRKDKIQQHNNKPN